MKHLGIMKHKTFQGSYLFSKAVTFIDDIMYFHLPEGEAHKLVYACSSNIYIIFLFRL